MQTITLLKDIEVLNRNITNSKGNKVRTNKLLPKGTHEIISNHFAKGILYLGEQIVKIKHNDFYFSVSLSSINNMNMRLIAESYCEENNTKLILVDFENQSFFTIEKKEIFFNDIT